MTEQSPQPQQSRSLRISSLCALLLQGLLVLSISPAIVAVKTEQSQLEPHPALTIASASTQPARALQKESNQGSDADTDLWCKIVVFDLLNVSEEDAVTSDSNSDISTTADVFHGCYPVTGNEVSELHYNIELPDAVVASQPAPEDLDKWWVAIPGGFIDPATAAVVVPDPTTVRSATGPPAGRHLSQEQLDRHHSRRLAEAKGTLKVLVVYINAQDASPTPSTNDLYETAFENEVSLKHQFARCSLNQLNLEPTALGVLSVTVPMRVGNADKTAFVNAAEDLALARIQSITGDNSIRNTRQYADLVMYIVPPGTGNWLAYASVGGGISVYNDKWGIYLSATAHEIGHNLKLRHAGEGGSAYSDHTGFMSGAIIGVHDKVNFPKQCYNAHNHWDLGWYAAEKMETVEPTTTGNLVKIVAFADVATATAAADRVLVQTGGDLDFYMQYNRATGFNADTYEYQDKLVVVQDNGDGSMIRATLDQDNESLYTRQEGNSKPLRIEICEQVYSNNPNKPDYLMVGIGYSSSTLCNLEPDVVETTVQTTVTGFGSLIGLGTNPLEVDCLEMAQECSFNFECCSQNCHNYSCTVPSGRYSAKSKADLGYDLSGFGGFFNRGARGNARGRRGLRGLKGAVSKLVVD